MDLQALSYYKIPHCVGRNDLCLGNQFLNFDFPVNLRTLISLLSNRYNLILLIIWNVFSSI
jgi:hypothetical protein